jgi:hypothetical protein
MHEDLNLEVKEPTPVAANADEQLRFIMSQTTDALAEKDLVRAAGLLGEAKFILDTLRTYRTSSFSAPH